MSFDPKKTYVDEHIDLINTLGDMVDQKEEARKEKFIETMPMMIQMHLIICKDWADVKDKAKSLKHTIQKCNPPTNAMPLMATGATVPGLCLHIAHSVDKEEGKIAQPFKGAKPKQTRGRGKPKEKPQDHSANNFFMQTAFSCSQSVAVCWFSCSFVSEACAGLGNGCERFVC